MVFRRDQRRATPCGVPLAESAERKRLHESRRGLCQLPARWKHSITVNIVVKEGKIGGTLVLVDGIDGSEIESPIINPELSGRALKFETYVKNAIFSWELILKGGERGGCTAAMDICLSTNG